MRRWVFYKTCLLIFVLTVLVNPGFLENVPGPSNISSRGKRRRLVAQCRKCGVDCHTEAAALHHEMECDQAGVDTEMSERDSEAQDSEAQDSEHDDSSPSLDRHKIVTCDLCGSLQRSDHIERHKSSRNCRVRCGSCGLRVEPHLYEEHRATHSLNLNLGFSQSSRSSDATSSPFNEEEIEADLLPLYQRFSKYITTKAKIGRIMDKHNFQIDNFSAGELVYHFKKLFRLQKSAFKINLSMGIILQHKTTGEYRFSWSSQNNQLLLDKPRLIRNSDDKAAFIQALNQICLINKVHRPNSEWIFVRVTNIEFFLYRLPGVPIGSHVTLPAYLQRNKGLYSLTCNRRGVHFIDKKCFFRCLALHKGAAITSLEGATKKLLKQYCKAGSITDFSGITLDQLEEISRIFEIGINVYTQDEDRNTELIFRSTLSNNVMNLNLHEDHFSYIKNLDHYSQSYRCHKCDKIWAHSGMFHRHIKTCEVGLKEFYGNGTFQVKKTIFEELQDSGIYIESDLRNFPYRATFDIECMLKKTDIPNSEKVEYLTEHELVSVSVCSNVDGFMEPKCFVLEKEGEQKKLVKDMINYLLEISETSAMLLREKYADYLEQINASPLHEKFENYLNQLPVLSFNGARYDLKVLKTQLIPVLVEMDSIKFVIKKGTGYMVIATEELKFLDATYYIAPGFSYEKFIKAYGATQRKSFFPYEYLDSHEKLDSKVFPGYDSFYSSLKNGNTLEPVGCEIEPAEVRLIGRTPTKSNPLTEQEVKLIGFTRYQEMKSMFENCDWCLKDYLMFYNNLDVKPFIEALENMSNYYTERGVDVFKDAVSAPGIAERIAFQTLQQDETFFLFNKKNKDLVKLFRNNMVGGPALIFDRYQESGKTNIRHDPNGLGCVKVLGFDANALYLSCMAENSPCGMYIRRQGEKGFIKEYPTKQSYTATHWLSSLEDRDSIFIQHARNGSEYRVGSKKIPVDGFSKTTNTVYQFHGCFFHGCRDCFNEAVHDRKGSINSWKSYDERRSETDKIDKYIIEQGHNLVTIWECQWKEQAKKERPANKYHYPGEEKYRLSEAEILQMVKDGSLFGALEVDIEVPENLKEKFSEMTPIFKNIEVTEEDIGDYMRNYLEASGKKFQNTRYLIGSMFGKNILLITPLLKWYLEHGLVVTKVHQLVQFNPKRCFERFANQVSDDRRAGDSDPNMAMIAETSKLLGNSVYGHSIMDKSKFTSVTFCGIAKASMFVNEPFFQSLDEFDDETFEVVRTKKSVKYDLPLQLGFYVYQYAKLKMLSFYFDIVDRFVERKNFSLLEMDTDSLYLALSADSLDKVIKPELWEEWLIVKRNVFPKTDTPENKAYDKRTPGLFKLEWSGAGFVGLNAKTYYCFDPKGDKHSSKGISRAFTLSKEDYLEVLHNKSTAPQINRGFIYKNNKMLSYEQTKQGLNYFYCKRKLSSDGFSTTYLDV